MPDDAIESTKPETLPVVPQATLEHETPKSGWKRFYTGVVGGAMLVTSHFVALCVSLFLLLVLPLVLFIVAYVILFIIASTTSRDLGSPVTFPVGCMLIVCYGLSMAAITCVANIVADTMRRLLHWPLWIPPVAVIGLSFIVLTAYDIVHDRQMFLPGIRYALLPTLALIALFCVYWIPLTFTGAVLRMLKWGSKKTWRTFRQKPAAQIVKPPAP